MAGSHAFFVARETDSTVGKGTHLLKFGYFLGDRNVPDWESEFIMSRAG